MPTSKTSGGTAMAFDNAQKPVSRIQAVEQVRKPDICQANGCFLPAGRNMGGEWLCGYHIANDCRAWGAISLALRTNRTEVLTLIALRKVTPVEAKMGWDRSGTAKVPVTPGDDVFAYETKLAQFVAAKVKDAVGERTWSKEPAQAENRLQKMLGSLNIVRGRS